MKLYQKLINPVKLLLLMLIVLVLLGKTIQMTSDNIAINSTKFSVDKNGNMTCSNANVTGGKIDLTDNTGTSGVLNVSSGNYNSHYRSFGSYYNGPSGYVAIEADYAYSGGTIYVAPNDSETYNRTLIQNGNIDCVSINPSSLEEKKKNFEKLQNGLDIIKNIDIYKYNFKHEEDNTKKHIGFVIGDNYNYSKEVTSKENDGADIYSFVSVCCKAIQEQQQQIEELKSRIEKLEKGDK